LERVDATRTCFYFEDLMDGVPHLVVVNLKATHVIIQINNQSGWVLTNYNNNSVKLS